MKILFLCHRMPYPPKRGGKIRPFNMIRHLSRSHEVTVATLARTPQEWTDAQELRRYCPDLHVGRVSWLGSWARFGLFGLTGRPATFGYFHSPSLARSVQRLLATRGFDAILVHCSSMGPYVGTHRGSRKVMDFGDADSAKWMEYSKTASFPLSWGFRVEGERVREAERRLGAQFHACSVNAPRERDELASYVRTPISEIPDAQLYIVGMDPSPAVRRLADGDRVVVTGRVEDVRPYFDSAAVAVAPLRVARGLQNKVLEAMAMRVPVVASPAAFAGITAVAGRDLLVAADAREFSRNVVTLLRDPAARERFAT